MQDMQEEIETKEFTATVGGGAVTAVVNGKNQILDIKIKPEVIDPDDVEMLQDLILTACNEALKNAAEEKESEMKKIGMPNMPGMF
jgi:DNA-binding YbaB/EbfC family protein